MGHVPRGNRGRWTSALDGYRPDQLKGAFAGWFGAAGQSRDRFRDLLLHPGTPDKVVDDIRAAARGIVGARTQEELNQGSAALAAAAQQTGPGNWARFVADSNRRAEAAISDGRVPGVTRVSAGDAAVGVVSGLAIMGAAMWWLLGGSKPEQATKPVHSPAPAELPSIAPATPPRDAKDPDGAKAPGKPGVEEGFKDPKRGESWVPNPNGKGYGWLDASGDVWVPSGPGRNVHGGPHWDVQTPGKGYRKAMASCQTHPYAYRICLGNGDGIG